MPAPESNPLPLWLVIPVFHEEATIATTLAEIEPFRRRILSAL